MAFTYSSVRFWNLQSRCKASKVVCYHCSCLQLLKYSNAILTMHLKTGHDICCWDSMGAALGFEKGKIARGDRSKLKMVFVTTTCIDSCLPFEIFLGCLANALLDWWGFPKHIGFQAWCITARGRCVKCIMSNCNCNYRPVIAIPSTSRLSLIIQSYIW